MRCLFVSTVDFWHNLSWIFICGLLKISNVWRFLGIFISSSATLLSIKKCQPTDKYLWEWLCSEKLAQSGHGTGAGRPRMNETPWSNCICNEVRTLKFVVHNCFQDNLRQLRYQFIISYVDHVLVTISFILSPITTWPEL